MCRDDFRYRTSNISNEIADFGIIEVASAEWYYWDGKIPESFKSGKCNWLDVINKAKGKLKYIPRLEIELE